MNDVRVRKISSFVDPLRGHVHMMSAVGGGEGGTPKADVVREVA